MKIRFSHQQENGKFKIFKVSEVKTNGCYFINHEIIKTVKTEKQANTEVQKLRSI